MPDWSIVEWRWVVKAKKEQLERLKRDCRNIGLRFEIPSESKANETVIDNKQNDNSNNEIKEQRTITASQKNHKITEELKQEIMTIETECFESLEKEELKFNEEIQKKDEEILKKDKKISELEEENFLLQMTQAAHDGETLHLEQKLKALKEKHSNEIQRLQQKLEKDKIEIKETKLQNTEHTKEFLTIITRLQTEISDLKEEIKDLQKKQPSTNEKILHLLTELQIHSNDVTQKWNTISKATAEYRSNFTLKQIKQYRDEVRNSEIDNVFKKRYLDYYNNLEIALNKLSGEFNANSIDISLYLDTLFVASVAVKKITNFFVFHISRIEKDEAEAKVQAELAKKELLSATAVFTRINEQEKSKVPDFILKIVEKTQPD